MLGVNVDEDDKKAVLLSSIEDISKYSEIMAYLWVSRGNPLEDTTAIIIEYDRWLKEQIDKSYTIDKAMVVYTWKGWKPPLTGSLM